MFNEMHNLNSAFVIELIKRHAQMCTSICLSGYACGTESNLREKRG